MKPSLALAAAWVAALAVPGLALQKERPKEKEPPAPWSQGRQKKPKGDGPVLTKLPDDYVRFQRVPEQGTMPRVVVGGEALALVFWKGDATRGDLFLTRSVDEGRTFSAAQRLNVVEGSVPSVGLLQTASVVLAPDGRACASWIQPGETPSLWFAHDLPDGSLAPAVDLGSPAGLCGTTAVTVDRNGTIFVFFAAGETSEGDLGLGRRIFLRTSTDGVSFGEAAPIDRGSDGVSEQSASAVLYDASAAALFYLYREAHAKTPDGPNEFRGMRMLISEDGGASFKSTYMDGWRQPRDPRSSAGLIQGGASRFAVWNARGSAFWAPIGRRNKIQVPREVKDEDGGIAYADTAGAANETEMLLTWLEQPAEPSAPARLAWRLWYIENRKLLGRGTAPELPGPGPAAVFARRSGGFTVLY